MVAWDFLKDILDFVLPRTCCVCGRDLLAVEDAVCSCCLVDLPLTRFNIMPRNPMADKFNALLDERFSPLRPDSSVGGPDVGGSLGGLKIESSGLVVFPYVLADALFFYRDASPYGLIPQSLKYKRNFAVGRYFGRMLGESLLEAAHFTDVDLVIPVPLHPLRRWKRGYNQAEVLAREVASVLGCRMDTRTLRRVRRTRTQTQLGVDAKRANVRGAFVARGWGAGGVSGSGAASVSGDASGCGGASVSGGVSVSGGASVCGGAGVLPAHILLLDDVFTTGATLSECWLALRGVFPPHVRISIATLGYVGEL